MPHQVLQNLELARQQLDPRAGAGDGPGQQIDLQVAERQLGLGRGGLAAPHQGFEPGLQLGECIGLGQVVVAAAAQSLHPVVHAVHGAEDQDRCGVPFLAQQFDDVQAVHAGQHAVDDHSGISLGRGQV